MTHNPLDQFLALVAFLVAAVGIAVMVWDCCRDPYRRRLSRRQRRLQRWAREEREAEAFIRALRNSRGRA